jgi:hypothetical protein
MFFKTPDALNDAVADALIEADGTLDGEGPELKEKLKYWVEHGESIVVDFDLFKMVGRVVPRSELK